MADENKGGMVDGEKKAPCAGATAQESQLTGDSDPELDELLDSALEDFGKPSPDTRKDSGDPSTGNKSSPLDGATGDATAPDANPAAQDAMFNDFFNAAMSDQMPDVDQMMKALMGEGGEGADFLQQFEKFAQASTEGMPGASAEGRKEFADTLQQTIGSMAQNAEELQNDIPEDELLKMMSSMGLGGEGAKGDMDFMPMMENVMKSLLSKDVLYPSLKEITSKYPAWLSENKGKVSDEEYSNYEKQNSLMKTIVQEFEQEKPEDSDECKKQRFDRILDTMQEMQELGQPPKEIVGEMPPGLDLDANGLPKFPGAEQCTVM